jgi:hypothetical protein
MTEFMLMNPLHSAWFPVPILPAGGGPMRADSAPFFLPKSLRLRTIRVKRLPKLDLVKPRPPAARRFYFTELAVPFVYIFVSSHVLANVANAAPVLDYRRDPPRCFVFSSSAAPDCPPRVSIASFPGVSQVSP